MKRKAYARKMRNVKYSLENLSPRTWRKLRENDQRAMLHMNETCNANLIKVDVILRLLNRSNFTNTLTN